MMIFAVKCQAKLENFSLFPQFYLRDYFVLVLMAIGPHRVCIL